MKLWAELTVYVYYYKQKLMDYRPIQIDVLHCGRCITPRIQF